MTRRTMLRDVDVVVVAAFVAVDCVVGAIESLPRGDGENPFTDVVVVVATSACKSNNATACIGKIMLDRDRYCKL